MKAKEIKAKMMTGKLDEWTVSRLTKTPMTKRQLDSMFVDIDGRGRVDITDVIRRTNFRPQDYKITLHFMGVSCPLEGSMVWDAFYEGVATTDRADSVAN